MQFTITHCFFSQAPSFFSILTLHNISFMQPSLRLQCTLKTGTHVCTHYAKQKAEAESYRRCRPYVACPPPLPHPQLPYILLAFSFTVHGIGRSELILPLHLSHTPFLLFMLSLSLSLLGRRFRHKGRLITTSQFVVPLPPPPTPSTHTTC